MTTQFGKELRKLRIDLGITLMDMATRIGKTAAFLSAVETGRKRVPDDFLEIMAAAFPEVARNKEKYEVLINQARKEVRMNLEQATFEDAELATALARRFSSMSPEEKAKLLRFVKKEG